jgi:predicted RNA methylase
MAYARMLGMDPVRDSELVWIADEMDKVEVEVVRIRDACAGTLAVAHRACQVGPRQVVH